MIKKNETKLITDVCREILIYKECVPGEKRIISSYENIDINAQKEDDKDDTEHTNE